MTELDDYKKAALKLVELKFLGGEDGYGAKIPSFAGLIVLGQTEHEALVELESALEGWIEFSLSRGDGLPSLHGSLVEAR